MRILAYRGAMSRWFTLNPEMAKPEQPTAMMRHATAVVSDLANATPIRNRASPPNPPQLKIYLTLVVERIWL